MIRASLLAMCFLMVNVDHSVAQRGCGSHARMKVKLESTWNEVKRGAYYETPRTLIEVWSTGDGGTWTIIRVYANGTACVIASGMAHRAYLEGDWT